VSTANSSDSTTAESSPSQEPRVTDYSSNLSEKLSTLSVSISSKEQQILSSEDGGPSTVELEKRIRALKKKVILFIDYQSHWLFLQSLDCFGI